MNIQDHILAAADRCVMCGLCLPHCPTYQLHHSESESPRGRIALMQALAAGRLGRSEALLRHLDSCLVCRACEKMCPSKVPYGELIDTTRALLQRQGTPTPASLQRLLDQVIDKEKLQRNARLLRGYQQSGLQRLLRGSGLLRLAELEQVEATLPELPPQQPLAPHYPARGEQRGRVGLFTGCIGSLLEGEVHLAAIELFTRLGYAVYVPPTQVCCGALHQHSGNTAETERLARRNIRVFSTLQLDAVVSTASGCAAQLHDYPQRFGTEGPPFYEACEFLNRIDWPEGFVLKPMPQRAVVHLPCSQRNILNDSNAVTTLLSRIPQLQCEPLAENHLCCGAAGSYQITQQKNAAALRERKLQHIREDGARLLISNNIGCAVHLQAGLRQRGMVVELFHPLVLLRRHLP